MELYDQVISRFGGSTDPLVKDQVAKAWSRKERFEEEARQEAARKAKAEADREAKLARKVERRAKVRRAIASIRANKGFWRFVAWVGVVFGYMFYIYPGVVAHRQLKRWEVDPRQSPWLAWVIGSIVVFSFPVVIIAAAIGAALGVPTSP